MGTRGSLGTHIEVLTVYLYNLYISRGSLSKKSCEDPIVLGCIILGTRGPSEDITRYYLVLPIARKTLSKNSISVSDSMAIFSVFILGSSILVYKGSPGDPSGDTTRIYILHSRQL